MASVSSWAYSRDPSLLFNPPSYGFAPPLNFETKVYDGKQPVRYQKQKLLHALGSFKQAGETIEVIDIHWLTGEIMAFHNVEEALNGIPLFSMHCLRIPCSIPLSAMDCIQETISLLRRGHSLTHPLCTCHHDLSEARSKTLGISHPYSEYNRRRLDIPCALSRRPREFTAKEVSDELGITDIILFKVTSSSSSPLKTQKPLLQILGEFCNLRIEGMQLFLSLKQFYFGPLLCKEDLISRLAMNPLPQTLSLYSYPTMMNDIDALVADGLVYICEGKTHANLMQSEKPSAHAETITLFYFNPRWSMVVGCASQELISMWHSVDSRELKSTLLDKQHFISASPYLARSHVFSKPRRTRKQTSDSDTKLENHGDQANAAPPPPNKKKKTVFLIKQLFKRGGR